MSAPEPVRDAGEAPGVSFNACRADIVEIAAWREREAELEGIAQGRGVSLPPFGRISVDTRGLALCVRPGRWLVLAAPAAPGVSAARWEVSCAGLAAVVDLSSGLAAFHLAGPAIREMLARGCRLDLDPEVFPVGSAAATPMIQVATILGALPSGLLMLTPASTARHVHEWLVSAAGPFGLESGADVTVAALSGDRS